MPSQNSPRSKWPRKSLSLAREYISVVEQGEKWGWKAAIIAVDLRATFSRRAKKGRPGWEAFCKQKLKRHANTIGTYMRAARYCTEQETSGWPDKLEGLPPWYLVAELAGRQPGPEREALHKELFDRAYHSIDEFRKSLSQLAEIEEARESGLSKRRKGKGKGKGGKRVPSMQIFSREKICNEILPKKLPEKNRVMEVADWMDVVDLGKILSMRCTANGKTIARMGILILVSPLHKDKK